MTALRQSIETQTDQPAFLGVSRSVRGLRWVERLDPARSLAALAISQLHGLPDLLARVLAARGAEAHTVKLYLDPSLRTLMPDPAAFADMEKAADRFASAILRQEKIAVFGDYDVDGAVCIALIRRFLRAFGQEVRIYVPDRQTEGYGPTPPALEQLAQEGARLILTVDCGTNAEAAIAAATRGGADVIVLDHHQADDAVPKAFAIVNPNRQDDLSGQGHLAAAGIVFLFLVATAARLKREPDLLNAPVPDLLAWLDLVALATICDVVPLQGVNRAFVAKGLQAMRLRQNAGLRALADVAGLAEAPTTYALGYILGPRINAGGRIGEASLGAQLLACEDDIEARAIAITLERLNAERRAIEARMLEEASAMADAVLATRADINALVLASEGWHRGVIGLIASRLCERFSLPTAIVAWNGEGQGTGSVRSVPGVDVGYAIRAAVRAGLLLRGGGHAMAGGFTVERHRYEALAAFLDAELAQTPDEASPRSILKIDGALLANAASRELMELLDRAGPYGAGHPLPRFAFPNHRISRLRLINETHLRCTLQSGQGGQIEAAAFRVAGAPLGELLLRSQGNLLHVAGHLRRDRWNGRDSVELLIEDAAEARANL